MIWLARLADGHVSLIGASEISGSSFDSHLRPIPVELTYQW